MGSDICISEEQAEALLVFLRHHIQEEVCKYSSSVDSDDYLTDLLCAFRDLKRVLGDQDDG